MQEEGGRGGDAALLKRLSHRAELRIILLEPDAVRKMPPGSFVAMGTNGLSPVEIRAIAHALRLACATPTAAVSQRVDASAA